MSKPSNIKKELSFQTKGLFENIEKLIEEADAGKNEAVQRLEAIRKLADPVFDFSYSDYQRILDKKLPLPVKKGIELYKMMNQLTYLVQPIGKRKGVACSVRRIDYENLTWDEFLELRGSFNAGFIMEAMKQRAEPTFNGLNMLNEEQKELYERLGVYFGKKKKPTLQSLAMNLLNEQTGGKEFSERSLYIYLDAIEEHLERQRKASGFNFFTYTIRSVTTFNNEETIRESLEAMDRVVTDSIKNFSKAISVVGGELFKNLTPQLTENVMPQIIKNFISPLRFPDLNEALRAFFKNQSTFLDPLE
jgi:hypothetical protein